ncbi:hypothetical protein MATL_G00231490 [Megalops atlanticus]|uniref:non-specific serine/threonine protein kinase n=1 Tax=Megalops atlanticus TaxID=7932 RepID=A0A9D3SVT3_MEGAT|nr:hypothetical protein MATL_G00231490 [Megalops atlanticus]
MGYRTFGKPPLHPGHFDDPRHHHGNNGFHTTHAENSPVRPRIVTVVKPGGRTHLRKITILLNRRSVQTFEQLVADISEALGYPRWKNDRIRKLFNLKGREIRGVSDFFRSDEVFVASGRDKLSLQDIEEVLEELYPDSPHYHGAVLQDWEKVLRPAVNASKADSGFHEELEPVRNLVPQAADGLRRFRDKACQEDRLRAKQWEKVRGEGQRNEKSQARRAKEGFLLKDKIQKLNAIYCPNTNYCKNCTRTRGGRQQDDPIRGTDACANREGQVEEREKSLEIGRTPQRFSRSVHQRPRSPPWERQSGRERNIRRSQEHEDSLYLHGQKETQSSMKPEGVQEVCDGTSNEIREPPVAEAEGEKLAQDALQGDQGSAVKENGFAPLVLEPSSKEHGDVILHDPPANRGEEKKEQGEGRDPGGPPEDPDALLPVGPAITRSDIERHFEIGRVVGDGNFAVVRECRLRAGGALYAMKIIDKEKLKGKEQMILNEISIVRSLSHPHVVRLLHDYETEDQIYLLMEFVHGGDLFDAITESVKFSEHHASLMVKDVCEALAYIHGKNIVHRDLKPENLLVQRNPDGSSTLKLADFGLAMVVTEPVFTVCGTPTYVAPEILSEKGYGLPVDMWAAGVILYILLCGFPPFRSQEKDQDELFELIQQGEYEFLTPYWDNVSDGAKGLVRELLLVDPAARLTARQALSHPWVQNRGQEGSLQQGATMGNTNNPPVQDPISSQ